MNSKYCIILASGEKITIEAYTCKVGDDRFTYYYKNKSIAATFFIRNIAGFYEIF